MKKFIIFLIFMPQLFYGQWMQQVSGNTNALIDVFSITENIVLAVGENGTILKTTNGGNNWVQKTSGTTQNLWNVKFTSNLTGLAVGSNGTVLKTIDAGDSWSVIPINTTTNLLGLSVLNANEFIISGDNGFIKKTVNGGLTFTNISYFNTQTIKNVQFVNSLVGYANADKLIKTIDGGITWNIISNDFVNTFYFVNENIGFINTTNSSNIRTIDAGLNYTYLGYSAYLNDIFSVDGITLWGVEKYAPLCACPKFCIVKGNIQGAANYSEVKNCDINAPNTELFYGIHFANNNTGYAVCASGNIYKNSTGNMLSTNKTDDEQFFTTINNPAVSFLNIKIDAKIKDEIRINIYDITGKSILLATYNEINNIIIDIQDYSKGLYFVDISTSSITKTTKLFIN